MSRLRKYRSFVDTAVAELKSRAVTLSFAFLGATLCDRVADPIRVGLFSPGV